MSLSAAHVAFICIPRCPVAREGLPALEEREAAATATGREPVSSLAEFLGLGASSKCRWGTNAKARREAGRAGQGGWGEEVQRC